ncbi:hypothetical protein Ark11_0411 [Candidatus Ichthyocystis hellenicum]|uniref:Uncharacterized protein n=1 Tax=Candidatus Ichthyocystis hellenicum TaxID=1561003 RepID=A0A0S4M2Q8_9BURK|nr:hypothetical protein [Candidatus Ichthyocystis hellenicum]CUT17260.1 hypothetical protein Ark11_0411 [Candidatus Ichthyocystis hellenicum]
MSSEVIVEVALLLFKIDAQVLCYRKKSPSFHWLYLPTDSLERVPLRQARDFLGLVIIGAMLFFRYMTKARHLSSNFSQGSVPIRLSARGLFTQARALFHAII